MSHSISCNDESFLPIERRYVLSNGESMDLHISCNKMCVITIHFEDIGVYFNGIFPKKVSLSYGEDK